MRRFSGTLGLSLLFLAIRPALAQSNTTPTRSDPQAVMLAAKAMAALTGGMTITDVTLTGTAIRRAGSDLEEGNITLEAKGTGESRLDLATSGGARSEVRNSTSGPTGFWVGLDGTKHAMAGHNCLTDAAWFFPAFSVLSQASSASVIATYIGQEARNGAPVQHIRFAAQFPGADAASTAVLTPLTAEDVYLDSATLLPVAITFNTHPDNDALTNIVVEIDFGNYQNAHGAAVPFKIQKLLNNSLFLDITIQSVSLNSGLSDSTFAIQ